MISHKMVFELHIIVYCDLRGARLLKEYNRLGFCHKARRKEFGEYLWRWELTDEQVLANEKYFQDDYIHKTRVMSYWTQPHNWEEYGSTGIMILKNLDCNLAIMSDGKFNENSELSCLPEFCGGNQ